MEYINLEKLEQIVNSESLEFVTTWIINCSFAKGIPVELVDDEPEKNFIYMIFRTESGKYKVASLAKKQSGCKPTFLGDLSYFCLVLAVNSIKNGWAKRHSNEVFSERMKFEKIFTARYNLPEKYFWYK